MRLPSLPLPLIIRDIFKVSSLPIVAAAGWDSSIVSAGSGGEAAKVKQKGHSTVTGQPINQQTEAFPIPPPTAAPPDRRTERQRMDVRPEHGPSARCRWAGGAIIGLVAIRAVLGCLKNSSVRRLVTSKSRDCVGAERLRNEAQSGALKNLIPILFSAGLKSQDCPRPKIGHNTGPFPRAHFRAHTIYSRSNPQNTETDQKHCTARKALVAGS